MTHDRLDPISETALPHEPIEHRTPGSETNTAIYPDLGRADPSVADPAFGLDDTDPNPATGAPQGANDPVRWPHDDVLAREADEADPPSASIKDEAAADLPETESSWP